MKIAVSGAHQTGKTTLIEELVASLPTFEPIDEPYYLLEAEGHLFAEMLSLEDPWTFALPVIEVTGHPGARARQVLADLGDDVRPPLARAG